MERLTSDVEDLRRENAMLRKRLTASEKRHEEVTAELRAQRALIPTPQVLGEEASKANMAIAVQLQRQSAENQELMRLLRKAKHNFESAVGEVRDNAAHFERRWGAKVEEAVTVAAEAKIRQLMRPEELQGALHRLRESMEASQRQALAQRETDAAVKFLSARLEVLEKRNFSAANRMSYTNGNGVAASRPFSVVDPLGSERRTRVEDAVATLRKLSSSSSTV